MNGTIYELHTKRLIDTSLFLLFLHLFFFDTGFSTFGYKHLMCLRVKRSPGVKILDGGCHVTSLVSSSSELVIAGYTIMKINC